MAKENANVSSLSSGRVTQQKKEGVMALFGGAFLFLLMMAAAVVLNFETTAAVGAFITELVFFASMALFLISFCLILLQAHASPV